MARYTPKHAAPRHYRGKKPAVKPPRTPERVEDTLEITEELPTESFTTLPAAPSPDENALPAYTPQRLSLIHI